MGYRYLLLGAGCFNAQGRMCTALSRTSFPLLRSCHHAASKHRANHDWPIRTRQRCFSQWNLGREAFHEGQRIADAEQTRRVEVEVQVLLRGHPQVPAHAYERASQLAHGLGLGLRCCTAN